MANEIKLKPCPFCENANGVTHSIGRYWNVDCEFCKASGPLTTDREQAERMWNDAPRPLAPLTELGKGDSAK